MHECPKTHFKHKCMHASHHATSSCHVTMPLHHDMSPCHITIPCHHTTSACHVIMPHHHATSPCHITMPHHHDMSSCLYSMDAMCHPVSGATWHLFLLNLPVDLIEQNTITFSYGVRLRRNKCRWNRLDEPFDLVLVLLRLEDFKKNSFLDPPGLGKDQPAQFPALSQE